MTNDPVNLVMRDARVNAGLTMRELARVAKVGQETVRRLEVRGLGARPANAKRVADVLGLRVTDLMPPRGEA